MLTLSALRKLTVSLIAVAVFNSVAYAQPEAATRDDTSPDAAAIVEQSRAAAIEKWEADIKKLELLDATENRTEDSILFIGSSSIRRWDTMHSDMHPWPTVRRGYGGAKFTDLAVYVDRLIAKHDYRALVIFVANDISGRDSDRSPEEVLALFQLVSDKALKAKPGKPVFYIEITPTSSRFDAWDAISTGNLLIKQYCDETPNLHFIQTAKRFLGGGGRPRDELFVDDKLHLNADGYKLWAEIISQHLDRKLKQSK